MKELKPCPFCNESIDIPELAAGFFGKSSDGGYLVCCDCGATGPTAKTMELAIDAWDRRENDG